MNILIYENFYISDDYKHKDILDLSIKDLSCNTDYQIA